MSTTPLEPGLLDERGCLTARGLATVVRAPVGKAPDELAVHLASCVRCQERLLATGREKERVPRARPQTWRNLLLVLIALLAGLVALGMTLAILGGHS